jgi:hypothetical protein
MAMTFLIAAKNKSRDSIAALAESLELVSYAAEWLRFCTSAANGNPKRLKKRKLLNRVIEANPDVFQNL